MNDTMYQFVKQELAKGTSIEDIMKGIETAADRAKEELQGPISRDISSNSMLEIARNSILNYYKVNKTSLITLIGAYMVQNGVNADSIAKTYTDFREAIEETLDSNVKTFRQAAAIGEKAKNGASDKELLHEVMKTVTDNFKGLFGSEPNFWQL